jgi:peptidoglycan/xylan/chitin deacetylase (PgdA/CDA1 family)
MSGLIHTARKWLYRVGALGAYHRIRNRRALTVAMFHRVLAAGDPRAAAADPEWTVSEEFFEACLRFFVRHYHVIGLGDLLDSLAGGRELPERPLLITFDDGWADTEEYAARSLRKMNLPAVAFVVAESVGGREPWSETVRRLWRRPEMRPPILESVENATLKRAESLAEVIQTLSGLQPDARRALTDRLRQFEPARDEMISREQIAKLRLAGCEIGSHGLTHTSISIAPDAWHELYESRRALGRMLGDGAEAPAAFSFPNGRYNAESIQLAGEAGYACVFTSDSHLNSIGECRSTPAVFGRIDISGRPNSDARGRLREEALAAWLFPRTIEPVAGIGIGKGVSPKSNRELDAVAK